MIKEGLSDNETYERSHKGSERAGHADLHECTGPVAGVCFASRRDSHRASVLGVE